MWYPVHYSLVNIVRGGGVQYSLGNSVRGGGGGGTKITGYRIHYDTGTTLLRSCLCRSAVAVCSFAHTICRAGLQIGPAGFKAGQAFTAVYNRASRLYSRPARFKTGRPAIKPAAGFQAGQVYNRALTYIYICDRPHKTLHKSAKIFF